MIPRIYSFRRLSTIIIPVYMVLSVIIVCSVCFCVTCVSGHDSRNYSKLSVSSVLVAAAASSRHPQQQQQQRRLDQTTVRSLQQQGNDTNNSTTTTDEPPRHDGSSPDDKDIVVIIEDPFNTDRDLLTVGGFVESDDCWIHLDNSDLNADGRISNDEYVTFAKLLTDDVLSNQENIETYGDLPLVFQLAFSSTACLCQNSLAGGTEDDDDCCTGDNAHIRIPVQPSNNPNTTEANYLYTTCSLTQGAAEVYLTSDAPTTSAPAVVVLPPSDAPTVPPVVDVPTLSPVVVVTTLPTTLPVVVSPAPVVATTAPSQLPAITPSSVAPSIPNTTIAVSAFPTAVPSFVGSVIPTVVGSSVPPSNSPIISADTTSPTPPSEVIVESMLIYDIAIANGTNVINSEPFVSEYLANLVLAMNTLAASVALNVSSTVTNQNNSTNGRYLQADENGIEVSLPTELQEVNDITCPSTTSTIAGNNDTLCQSVSALILFIIPDTADASTTQAAFDQTLLQEVRDGRLQTELNELVWVNTADQRNPITVLTGLADVPIVVGPPNSPTTTPAQREIRSTETLSSVQIAGIAIGAGAILSIILGYAVMKRSGPLDDDEEEEYDDKPKLHEVGPDGEIDLEKDLANASMADSSIYTDAAQSGGDGTGGATALAATTLGASHANYGGMSSKQPPAAAIAMGHDNTDDEPGGMLLSDDPDRDDVDDDDGAASSNAGSSGWSSSAGISSLNTGSMDEMDIAAAAGATLAGIGLASAFSRNLSKRGGGDDALGAAPSDTDDGHSDVPSVSRDQLDSLIESGDWAAVGATAALLAAASDSQSGTSLSHGAAGTAHSRSRDSQSVDAARAAELDHLVDAGDWEGVVAAAAKFEAQAETGTASGTGSGTGSRSSRTHSSVESSGGSGSNTGTGTNTAGSPSVTTSLSDTASKAQKREEIRSEVEALVRRVVPEEIDNVDEMMNQFKGREEELVETLRTMQERAVAQKARAAGHRAAKTEARRSVQRVGSGGPATPGSVVQKVASLEIKEAALGTGGIAAAGIGMAAASTAVLLKSSSKDDKDQKPAAQTNESKVVVDARSALEDAIDVGDWEAVVEAAAMISDNSITSLSTGEVDRLASTNISISTTGTAKSRDNLIGVNADRAAELDALIESGDWTGVVTVANKFSKTDKKEMSESTGMRSKEEEEALLEAELWMKIADQKKAEGAMDAGASDAAEWAIQRSLSQLRDAEKKQRRGTVKDEDEV